MLTSPSLAAQATQPARPSPTPAPVSRPGARTGGTSADAPPKPSSPQSSKPSVPATAVAPPSPKTATVDPSPAQSSPTQPTLDETRLKLSKWIETQQIISKERNDWQQSREILQGRIELVGKEVGQLNERIAQAEAAVAESNRKRDELAAQNSQLKETGDQLAAAASAMEARVRKLALLAPEGVATKLAPLLQRIPTGASNSRISTAERFQNVLGILNELNKANSEISIAYEIRKLSDGASSEVQVIYVGLAQAYYLSPRGEAGVGRPGEGGWTWQAAPDLAGGIYTALEIIQGKHPPDFVALPVTIQ